MSKSNGGGAGGGAGEVRKNFLNAIKNGVNLKGTKKQEAAGAVSNSGEKSILDAIKDNPQSKLKKSSERKLPEPTSQTPPGFNADMLNKFQRIRKAVGDDEDSDKSSESSWDHDDDDQPTPSSQAAQQNSNPPSPQESEIQETGSDQGFSGQSEESSTEVSPLTEGNLKLHQKQFDNPDQAAEAQNNQDLANAAATLGGALYERGMGTNSDSSQKNQDLEQDFSGMPEEQQNSTELKSAVDAAGLDLNEVKDQNAPNSTPEDIQLEIERQKNEIEEDKQNIAEALQGAEAAEDLEEQEFEDLRESIAKEAHNQEEQQDQAEEESELVEDDFRPPEGHNTPERQERMEKAHQEIEAGKKAKEMEAAEAIAQTQTPESLKDAETPPEGQNAEQAETLQNAQNQKVETASVGTQTDPQSTGKNTDLANSDDTPQSPGANPSASRPGVQPTPGRGDKVSFAGDSQEGDLPQQPGGGGGGGVGAGAGAGAGSRRELSEFDAITDAIQNRVLIPQQLALYSEYYKGQPDLPHDRKLEGLQKFREEVLATDQGRDFVENIMRNPQFQREMQQIETDGYRFVNQKFQHQFHDIAWPAPSAGARSSTITNPQGQAVCTLSESSISQPSNFTLANGSVRPVSSYRKINFPTRLEQPNGPMHLEMALKDENGQNMPDDGAVYFTAHYNKAGQLTEVSSPVPIKFMGEDDNAIGYIERIGSDGQPHVYTLPVTKGNYRDMMQEVERHNGLGVNMSKGMDQSQALSRDRAATVGIDSPDLKRERSGVIESPDRQQERSSGVSAKSQGFRASAQEGKALIQAAEQQVQNMEISGTQPQMRPPAPRVDAAIARMQAQIQQKQAAVAAIKSKKGGGKTTKGSTTRALKKAEKAVKDIELLNSRKKYALEKLLYEQSQTTTRTDLMGSSIDTVMGYSLKKADKLAKDYKLDTSVPPAEILDTTSRIKMDADDLLIPSSEADAAIDQLRAQVWRERAKLADVEMAKESRMSRAGLASDRHLEQLHKVQDIEALNARKIKILQENPEADKSEVDKIMRQGAAELEDKLTNREKEVFRLQSQSELQMPVIYNQQAPNVNRAVEQLQSQMWSKRADLAKMRTADTADPKKLAKAESAVQKIEELNSRKILALQTMLEQGREKNPQADLKASRVDKVMQGDLSKTNKILNGLGLDLEEINAVQTPAGPTTPAAPPQPSSSVLDEAIQQLRTETQEAKDEARKLSQKKRFGAPSTKKVEEAQARAKQIAEANAKKERVIRYRFAQSSQSGIENANDVVKNLMAQDRNATNFDTWIGVIDKEEAKLAAKSTGPKILDSVATQDPVDLELDRESVDGGVTGTTSQPVNADPLETKNSAAYGVVATSQNPTNFTDGMKEPEPQVGDPVKLKPPSAPPPPPPPLEKKREMLVGHVSALQKEATDPKVKNLYENALKRIPTLQEERVEELLTKNQTPEFSKDLKSLVPPPPLGKPPAHGVVAKPQNQSSTPAGPTTPAAPPQPSSPVLDEAIQQLRTETQEAKDEAQRLSQKQDANPNKVKEVQEKAVQIAEANAKKEKVMRYRFAQSSQSSIADGNDAVKAVMALKVNSESIKRWIGVIEKAEAELAAGQAKKTAAAAQQPNPASPVGVEDGKYGRGGGGSKTLAMRKKFGNGADVPPGTPITPRSDTPPVQGVNNGKSKDDKGRA